MPPIRRNLSILLDQNAPKRLIRALPEHNILRAYELGWSELANGELIAAAENGGFDIVVTADKNLRYQQNLIGRSIAVIIIENNRWESVKANLDLIVSAIDNIEAGSIGYVQFRDSR